MNINPRLWQALASIARFSTRYEHLKEWVLYEFKYEGHKDSYHYAVFVT